MTAASCCVHFPSGVNDTSIDRLSEGDGVRSTRPSFSRRAIARVIPERVNTDTRSEETLAVLNHMARRTVEIADKLNS